MDWSQSAAFLQWKVAVYDLKLLFFVFNSNVHTRAKPFICLNSLLFIFQCPQFFYVATESTFIISIAFHAYV